MEPTNLNEPTQAPAPVEPSASKQKSSAGALIALAIIVIALIGAAFFFLNERVSQTETTGVSSLEEQGTSTEPGDIEADLSAKSPDSFDADLDAAFYELETSVDSQ